MVVGEGGQNLVESVIEEMENPIFYFLLLLPPSRLARLRRHRFRLVSSTLSSLFTFLLVASHIYEDYLLLCRLL